MFSQHNPVPRLELVSSMCSALFLVVHSPLHLPWHLMLSSYECFALSGNNAATKWDSYFTVYDRHLSSLIKRTPTLFEIGVCDGGSLDMWRRFLGPDSPIIGLDINPDCLHIPLDSNTYVEIGDQSDHSALRRVISRYGTPDIVIDDGSHTAKDIIASLEFFMPLMQAGSVYIIEDLHGTFWGHERHSSSSNILNYFNQLILHSLNAPGSRGVLANSLGEAKIVSASYYWSMLVLEFGEKPSAYTALRSQDSIVSPYATINPRGNI